jgi:hypothetical protein
LAIHRKIGNARAEGQATFNIALALDRLGDRSQAIKQAEVALGILEHVSGENLARIHKQLTVWRERDA